MDGWMDEGLTPLSRLMETRNLELTLPAQGCNVGTQPFVCLKFGLGASRHTRIGQKHKRSRICARKWRIIALNRPPPSASRIGEVEMNQTTCTLVHQFGSTQTPISYVDLSAV